MASSSEIRSFISSDHAPVFLELAITSCVTTKLSWRLNDNLLKVEVCMSEIQEAVGNFCQIMQNILLYNRKH